MSSSAARLTRAGGTRGFPSPDRSGFGLGKVFVESALDGWPLCSMPDQFKAQAPGFKPSWPIRQKPKRHTLRRVCPVLRLRHGSKNPAKSVRLIKSYTVHSVFRKLQAEGPRFAAPNMETQSLEGFTHLFSPS